VTALLSSECSHRRPTSASLVSGHDSTIWFIICGSEVLFQDLCRHEIRGWWWRSALTMHNEQLKVTVIVSSATQNISLSAVSLWDCLLISLCFPMLWYSSDLEIVFAIQAVLNTELRLNKDRKTRNTTETRLF